jgi:mono/diheme cytochrome c family protein
MASEHPEDMPSDVHEMHDPILREKERPRDGYQPIPTTLLLIFFALLMWGGYYLGTYNGNWRVDILAPKGELRAGAAAGAPNGADEDVDLTVLGKRVYNQCAACHQQNGQGVAGAFPPLDGTDWVTGSPDVLTRILLHGLEGPIEVKGEVYEGQMPAWAQLDDREIAAVMTYIRSEWGNDAPPIEPDFVGKVREETADRARAWTAEELQAIEPDAASEGETP